MKKIFFYTDVLLFLSQDDKALEKLKKNLAVFKEAAEQVELVWHPWSGTEKYLVLNNSQILDKYRQVVDDYCKEGWGVLDTANDMAGAKESLLKCDAYYGDVSNLVYEAQNAGMPIMLQNIDV